MARLISIVFTLFAVVAVAEDEAQRRAREEIERQLNQLVGAQPSRVRVTFSPVDDPNFAVEDFEVDVDGKPVKTPTSAAIAGWVQDGPMPLGVVDVTPGAHKVNVKLTVHNTASALATEEGDHRWKLAGDVAFDVRAGLEVQVVVTVSRDAKQPEIAKRLRLSFPSKPVMIAKLEDATMPEAPKPAPVIVDAGPSKEELAAAKKAADDAAKLAAADAAKTKAEAAAAAKQAAADEKKRKAEEARAAKVAAADEKKRKAEEALAAKQAAADEKKRAAEEALAATQAAAEEKMRQAEQVLAAKQAEREGTNPSAEAPSESVDAGLAPIAAATPPEDAGAVAVAQPAVSEPAPEEGLPWPMIAGGGIALAAIVIFFARRSARVPQLKD